MKVRTWWLTGLAGIVAAVLAGNLLGHAQYSQTEGGVLLQGQNGSHQQPGFSAGPEMDPAFAAKRLRALNADRQKSMVSDVDKLVKLARQLDTEVASNPSEELTPEEVRKLAQIEKLARSVKAKMAQSFGGGPQLQPPAILPTVGPGVN